MAFSLGASNTGPAIPAELGAELPDVFAEEVGFKGVSGDSNVQFLPTPWPNDALPSPTSTLLAVAATKGIVVGAGPDSICVASSEAVRTAISSSTGKDKVKTKPFQPQATIPLPARPTHVVFASGDSALVLATENGSQLSIFETASLLQPNAQPALSIPTNGATFRALAPNPAPVDDSHSSLVALVTTGGELLIADLKGGNLISGPNGNILKTGVSSVCWSNKGKQLIAGLVDGTGYQMTPEGAQKDLIPRPSDITEPCHVSSIAWLENDIFLMVYTPNALEDDMGSTPSSSYYIITRRKQAPFLIRKLPELSSPFGFKRAPAYQFLARLRHYKPYLRDVLIVSSTASADVGLITRSDQPLTSDDTAGETVGLFVTTEVNDDTKKASVPLKDSIDETSVIGLGIDLSSSELVLSPIQGEDISESSTPLPNLLLLNHEGILCSWWFIYSDSIRQKIPYPGLASVAPQQQPQPIQQQSASQIQPTQLQQSQQQSPSAQPAFGQPAFGQSAFGQPAFGSSTNQVASRLGASGFGKPSATPAFGSTSVLGNSQQPAFGKPSFGTPGFGVPSQMGSSFGSTSALGGGLQFGKSGFGQPSTPGKAVVANPFGTPGPTSGGGFGSFASTGGFGSLSASKPSGQSPFSQVPTGGSPFAKPSGTSGFGEQAVTSQKSEETKSSFGLGTGGFVLGSTFKGDGTAVNDAPKPEKPSGLFSFGPSLDEMISTPTKSSPPTEAMDDMEDRAAPPQEMIKDKEPMPSPFGVQSKTATSGSSIFGSFGSPSQPQPLFASAQTNESPFSLFGKAAVDKQRSSPSSPPSEKTTVASPPLTQAKLPESEKKPFISMPEPPLPPDSTSKTAYGPGDTSASSNVSKSSVEDAPLPPDFTTTPKFPEPESEPPLPPDFTTKSEDVKLEEAEEAPLPPDFTTKLKEEKLEEAEQAPLPPDFTTQKPSTSAQAPPPVPDESDADESEKYSNEEDESDFEDSGEDITHDLGQPESNVPSLKTSPESSFGTGAWPTNGLAGGLFGRVTRPDQPTQKQQQPQQLFGEIRKPFFSQTAQDRSLPRSPSPVRPARTQQGLPKLDVQRSVSAPHKPGSALAARKASLSEFAKRESPLKPEHTKAVKELRPYPTPQTRDEALSDDEDERLRADLSRPLEPVPTLDPFLPHQDYSGQTTKPGIPGQVERLYRDINSMVDTLGINSRSLSSFLLYQQEPTNSSWTSILQSDHPADILDEKLLLREIEKMDGAVAVLAGSLEEQRVQGVEEKLESCRELLGKDIITLRSQCASVQKTLDAHTDVSAIVSAPLSAEQANIQQDLRSTSAEIQAKLADLESAVSLLRAKIADAPRADGSRQSMRRPTVEAVTSTIATMMNMVESKSSDIDVLEVQLKKLGIDTSAPLAGGEGSPFTTPRKGLGKLPTTPGSLGSVDGPVSSYHTPDSAARGMNFRASMNGSAKASRLRTMESIGGLGSRSESAQWKAKMQRKERIVGSLKKAIGEKKSKVRSVDDL